MATTRGPLMSLEATGTIGKTLTYGKWKGRSVVRSHIIPSNPRSAGQVGRRAMFRFLTQGWKAIPQASQESWQAAATALNASLFNGYLSLNVEAWHNFLAPSEFFPATRVNNPGSRILAAAAWEQNRIKLSTTAVSGYFQWGIIYFARLQSAVTPAVGSTIIVELDLDVANRDTFWTPPSAGRWYFNSITFSYDGKQFPAGGAVDTGP